MKLHRLIILSVFFFSIVGCTGLVSHSGPIKGNLNRSGAGDMIKNSTQFKKIKTMFVSERHIGGGCEYLNADSVERRLEQASLAALKTVDTHSLLGGVYCQLNLTDTGKKESFQRTDKWPDHGWSIPVANRQLGGVTGVVGGDKEAAEVEYTWEWAPNALCQKTSCQTIKGLFDSEERRPIRATATFKKYDDGWRLENCGC